jgi:hypothetical protein
MQVKVSPVTVNEHTYPWVEVIKSLPAVKYSFVSSLEIDIKGAVKLGR